MDRGTHITHLRDLYISCLESPNLDIFPRTCLSFEINKDKVHIDTLLSGPVSISLTSLSSGCILNLAMKSCGRLSPPHHPHQTPSLGPFRVDSVLIQIQVLQSRVLFEAFGQGLTGEIRWTSSPALESIKLIQTLGPLSPPLFLRFLVELLKQGMANDT